MTRKSAVDIAHAYLNLVGKDIPAWAELLAEDAVIEFPYAPSVGTPERLEGKAAILHYMKDVPTRMPGLTFSNLRIHETLNPDVVLAEVHGEATIAATGKHYAQDYVLWLEAKDGKLVRYREYWNPIPALAAFGGTENTLASFNVEKAEARSEVRS